MSFNTTLIIAIAFISLIGFSFIAVSSDIATNYNVTVPDQYNNSFNKFAQVSANYETTSDIIEGGDIDTQGQDQAVFKNTIIAGRQAMSVSVIAMQLISDLIGILQVNAFAYFVIAFIITVLSVSGFIFLLTGRRP